jgi:5S rRNA maturation endonuclease (ribonuclease M5)
MNKIATNQSPLYNQEDLKNISDALCDRIDDIFDYFEIDARKTSKMFICNCPIHGGDNASAFNIYPYGEDYRGNWKCRTHKCEEIFMGSIIGFIRGVLSHRSHNWQQQGDKVVSFADTLKFIEKFLENDSPQIVKSKNTEKNKFNTIVNNLKSNKQVKKPIGVPRNKVRQLLQFPCQYYIERGYSKEILDKYDIGLCLSKGKEMYNRVVAPIYDADYEFMIGCTGRSIFEKCDNCKCHHNTANPCPEDKDKYKYSKWKHNYDFKSQENLYNYWFAKDYIKSTGIAILVEGPGNVWRLEENGIHNSVAMFGSVLSDKQKILLDLAGAMTLVILTDNDSAGETAKKQIIKKCSKTYRIFSPQISKNDVGDMTNDEIEKEIKTYLEKIL